MRPLAPPAEHAGTPLATPHFLRFSIPAALGEDYDRLLYLDVDTWVENARLFSLFDLDLGGHLVAAVRDLPIAFVADKVERQQTLGPGRHKYLNSGVLLIDARRFRAEDVLARLAAIATEPGARLIFSDQSALNRLLAENWLELSPSFNMIVQVWLSEFRAAFDPIVVHFAGVPKFWQRERFTLAHPARAEFESFCARQAWQAPGGERWPPPLSDAAANAGARIPMRGYAGFFPGRSRLLRYLRETAFADVVQGITTPNLAALPHS